MPSGRSDIYKDAKPFKKGDPRINRKGAPKLPDLNNALADVLAGENESVDKLNKVIEKLYDMAVKGNLKAMEMLLDRGYGKPRQSIDHTSDNKPMPIINIIAPKDNE